MLSIKQRELTQVLNYLPVNENTNFLIQKLQAASQNTESLVQILVSEDDLDLMMDNLPAPQVDESVELKQARKTLQQFLSQLRFQ